MLQVLLSNFPTLGSMLYTSLVASYDTHIHSPSPYGQVPPKKKMIFLLYSVVSSLVKQYVSVTYLHRTSRTTRQFTN